MQQNKLTSKPFDGREIAVKNRLSSYPLLKEKKPFNIFHAKLHNLAPEIQIENDENL